MTIGPALEALFKFVLPMFMGLMILLRISGAGADKAQRKILEQEQKDREAFDEAGEEWDGRGGLGGIVTRRVQRKSWSLPKSLGLGK
ncbi:MAG: hypothetical protein ACWGQW_23215 [bacterium]